MRKNIIFLSIIAATVVIALALWFFPGDRYIGTSRDRLDDASDYNNRGVENQKLSKFGLAAEDYLKAYELDPDGKVGSIAYGNLNRLHAALKADNESLPERSSQEIYGFGTNRFDTAADLYNNGNYAEAKRYLTLAIRLFATARMIDPDNNNAYGFMFLAKGFFYYICGLESVQSVKPTDTNYTTMAYLRRAYYPLAYADAYYDLALECLTDPQKKETVKSYKDTNSAYMKKTVGKFLPKLDYWSKPYMDNVKKDVQCAVAMDRINETLVAGEYDRAFELIQKFETQLEKLDANQTGNKNGFWFMNLAYARLVVVLPHLSQGSELSDEQKLQIKGLLDQCLGDLKRARFEFGTAAYVNFSDTMTNHVERLKNDL